MIPFSIKKYNKIFIIIIKRYFNVFIKFIKLNLLWTETSKQWYNKFTYQFIYINQYNIIKLHIYYIY